MKLELSEEQQMIQAMAREFADSAIKPIAAEIDRHTYPREALADALKREAMASDAPQSVLANIELLRDPRTLVVATGQQAGFLGGPLYSLHKALSAVAQARDFAEKLQRPVVPVYWLAADDHDHGEIDIGFDIGHLPDCVEGRAGDRVGLQQ